MTPLGLLDRSLANASAYGNRTQARPARADSRCVMPDNDIAQLNDRFVEQ